MKLLFIHQNFPGQFVHLAPALAARGHEVHALGMSARALPGVRCHRYGTRRGTTAGVHPWVLDFEAKVIRAQACAHAARQLCEAGFTPDLIVAHPGWGEALLLREVWPAARQLHYVEFFYGADGQDVGFDPEFPVDAFDSRCRLSIKNTNNLLNLDLMDWGLCPTRWQCATVPVLQRARISVIHDGIDTRRLVPDAQAVLQATDDQGRSLRLTREDAVLTFVNRNLEPGRGYHRFMRALPALQQRCPQARIVIIGGDGVSYGAAPAQGSWKQRFLDEVAPQLDLSRVHFLGRLPYAAFIQALRVSRVHVYLTYPFVLSWSLLEAMSLGACVVASDTAPVREVIEHGRNGWLVDFFDTAALAAQMARCLEEAAAMDDLRQAARATIVAGYDLQDRCLPAQMALVEAVAAGGAAKP